MRPVRVSVKAVIIRDGALLLLRYSGSTGDWRGLPGGGQNNGETVQVALARECHEELGCAVQPGPLVAVREYIEANHEFARPASDFHQIELWFACALAPGAAPSGGHAPDQRQLAIEWVKLDQLEQANLFPRVAAQVAREVASGQVGARFLGDVN